MYGNAVNGIAPHFRLRGLNSLSGSFEDLSITNLDGDFWSVEPHNLQSPL